MKTVVTGGAGFIGSHLVDALIERGDEVHIVDNLSRGHHDHINSRAALHQVDIRDFERLAPLFEGAGAVFHAAALPRVERSLQDPRLTHDVNVNGTLNVLLASRDSQVKRVVFSSSSSIYGDQPVMPTREDVAPEPLSPYGLQKYVGELLCQLFSRLSPLETVALRYFTVYGPRMVEEGPYTLAIPKFLEQRRRGEALTITGDGTQSRGFTHVRDVVRANMLAAESPNVGKGEVINVGSDKGRTILELARLIGGEMVFIAPRREPKHTAADITKAKTLLGWQPEVAFEEGIRELITL